MVERGFDSNDDQPNTTDFQAIMTKEDFQLIDLLKIDSILNQIKMQSASFSKALLKMPLVVKDLLKIALQPTRDGSIATQYPYICSQILCCQEQCFYNHMLGCSTSYSEINIDGPQLLQMMFDLLKSEDEIDETAAGYLQKIFNQFGYHKAEQAFWLHDHQRPSAQQTVPTLLQSIHHSNHRQVDHHRCRFCNHSLIKIQKEKPTLINNYISSIVQCQDDRLAQRLCNLTYVIEDVSQKSQGRFGSAKYKSLLKLFYSFTLLDGIKHRTEKSPTKQVIQSALDIMLIMVKPVKNQKQRFESGNKQQQNVFELNEAQTSFMAWFLNELESVAFNKNSFVQPHQKKWLQLLRDLLYSTPSEVINIVDRQLILKIIEMFERHPNNNIIHIVLRDIIIYSLKFQSEQLVSKGCKLLPFIIHTFDQEAPYVSLVYSIAKAVQGQRRKNSKISTAMRWYKEQWVAFMNGPFQEKRKSYTRPIGGQDPRKRQQMNSMIFQLNGFQRNIESNNKQQQKQYDDCPWDESFQQVMCDEPKNEVCNEETEAVLRSHPVLNECLEQLMNQVGDS